MTTQELYSIFSDHNGISTDTRNIKPGSLFFALKGEFFDANIFAETALQQGASYAIIDNPAYRKNEQYILVENVLESLQDLARHHRRQLQIPFIGITGTNGKTTTKELIHSVLSQHYKSYATKGNLNNHIGVPLTILSIDDTIEIAVIEMGANHQKEIEFLCSIAQPTHGLITNVGKAHLEGFGGFEGVKKAKGELYTYLATNEGIGFINHDNHELMEMSRIAGLKLAIYYSKKTKDYVNGSIISAHPFLKLNWICKLRDPDSRPYNIVESNLTGTYNLENILAAITIGCFFDLTSIEINKGINSYKPNNNRSQIIKTAANTLICDYYNANPSSMAVALQNLESIQSDKKILILGDMFELGSESAYEHQAIFNNALSVKAERRIFIGSEFYKLGSGQEGSEFYKNTAEAFEALKKAPPQNATILIKGSRGMKLEQLSGLL